MSDRDTRTDEMVQELLDLESGLTEWEVQFLERMAERTSYTYEQAVKVEQIYNERT